MTTINDLVVAGSFSTDDKLPMWSNANGVTRALPISVLTARFLTQADIALIAASSAEEIFTAGVDFIPGATQSLTLANNYVSAANIDIHFDAAFQGSDQFSLVAQTLIFTSPIPVGVNKVYVHGGEVRSIGAPSDGTVTTSTIVDGAVTAQKLSANAVVDTSVASGTKLYNRIHDISSVTDFGLPVTSVTVAAAVTATQAAGGGLLHMPNVDYSSVALPANCTGVVFEYDGPNVPVTVFGESPGASYISQKVFRYQDSSAHAGHGHSTVHVESKPIGTGANGPTNADFALTISLLKQGFGGGSALSGELDGAYIAVRNDGASSDTTAVLFDVANYGAGFNALFEGNTSYITGGTVVQGVNNQAGVVDSRTNNQYGYVVQKTTGIGGVAYLAAQGAGQWQHLLQFSGGGSVRFDMPIDSNNVVTMRMVDASLNSKTIRVNNNALSVLNNAGNTEILSLSDNGTLTVSGLSTGIGIFSSAPGAGTPGALSLGSGSSATASAGGQPLPSNPAGFLNAYLGNTAIRLPYYLS